MNGRDCEPGRRAPKRGGGGSPGRSDRSEATGATRSERQRATGAFLGSVRWSEAEERSKAEAALCPPWPFAGGRSGGAEGAAEGALNAPLRPGGRRTGAQRTGQPPTEPGVRTPKEGACAPGECFVSPTSPLFLAIYSHLENNLLRIGSNIPPFEPSKSKNLPLYKHLAPGEKEETSRPIFLTPTAWPWHRDSEGGSAGRSLHDAK